MTITDLSRGQPLTPPVVETHRAATDVFTVGQPASFALNNPALAEGGVTHHHPGIAGGADLDQYSCVLMGD